MVGIPLAASPRGESGLGISGRPVAKPVFDIQEVARGGGQHNNISATKAILDNNPNAANPGQKAKVLKAQGVSALGKVDTGLKEFDVADKISDPSVHRYLHDTERTGNIAPADRTDNARLAHQLAHSTPSK
ncbi:MAG: hypothetical protein ABI949_13315 [Ilumatobacteraceae bacterium]